MPSSSPSPRPSLNLGIVAHVDAGKTTLTERLLFEAGVITHVGRVDDGDTTTDTDDLERRRGITIRSAVVAFAATAPDGAVVGVNLIDTPGHSDFVAEVERALAVLDGAVLVVSSVEGVQAQTRAIIRILERLGVPFLVFANKVDRVGASYAATMSALRDAIAGEVVAVTEPAGAGDRSARVVHRGGPAFVEDVVERLAGSDEALLDRYVEEPAAITDADARRALAAQTRAGHAHPVLFGSALHGLGVGDVLAALTAYLPVERPVRTGSLQGSVFKVGTDAHQRVAHVRLRAGTLAARDHVVVHRRSADGEVAEVNARVVSVGVFDCGAETVDRPATAGDIALVRTAPGLAVGDQLGRWDPAYGGRHFPPPGLESVVRPRDPADRSALFQALQQLAEQDPLIDARLDDVDEEIAISVYGEVQKEVIAARLDTEFGLLADLLPTRVVHVERVTGTGEGLRRTDMDNASVGLRIEPAPVGSGVRYVMGVERGYLLPSFHVAIQETLAEVMRRGPFGWAVTDCVVELVHARFHAPTPSAGEYRRLTALAFTDAVRQAATVVCAPVSRFELEVPAEASTAALALLAAAGGTPESPSVDGDRLRITGTVATAALDAVRQRVPGLTSGRGVLLAEPAGYAPVVGVPPTRGPRP